MRTTAIGLLIWLVIMLSERVFCMEGPSTTGQKDAPIIVPKTEQLEVELSKLPPRTWPALYSEDAIKKARKEGYRSGMQDSNQIIISLDAQRQQVLNHNLELQEKVIAARNQLDAVLKSVSPKASHIVQLQDILVLLNQAIEPPAK